MDPPKTSHVSREFGGLPIVKRLLFSKLKNVPEKLLKSTLKYNRFTFFSSEKKLMEFYNSKILANLKSEVQVLTEKVDVDKREVLIKRCTTQEKVTLLTKMFGRGTDFICRNQQL